jgi:hypothetical protein
VNRVGIPHPGIYSFSDVGDCYRYEGSAATGVDKRTFDTSQPEVIQFEAIAYLIHHLLFFLLSCLLVY